MPRTPRLLAPFFVLLIVLAACQGGGNTETGGASPGGGDEPAATGTGASPGGDGDGGTGGSITVTSLWGGAEEEAFQAVLDGFTEATGIEATFESQRTDYAVVLRTRIEGGDPPDVAIIPNIGFLRSFARSGSIIPLEDLGINREDIEGNYAEGVLDIGTVDDTLYGVMVKSNSKSTVWYKPPSFDDQGFEIPESWDDLKQITADYAEAGMTPWGLGAGPDSSWNLTDWFESIYVRQAGPDMYDQLFSGELPWTDQSVKDAISEMASVLNDEYVAGGIEGALGQAWTDGLADVFGADATAEMYYEGGFVGGIVTGDINPELELGTDFDWFDFPPINEEHGNPVTLGGDLIAAFTDEPGVAEFIQYMTTAEAGEIWAESGLIISPLKDVNPDVYRDDTQRREADQIANADAVRFDGSDLMPAGADVGAMLQEAIAAPDDIDGLLQDFEDTAAQAWEDEQG